MTDSSVQNDTLELQFLNPKTNAVVGDLIITNNSSSGSFDNSTRINFEKDYFTPANGITIVIEDDRINQLTTFLQRGLKVKVLINGNLNMTAFIFEYNLTYNKNSGTQLTLSCKDLLEYMAQGTVYPNMGQVNSAGQTLATNFHFKPTDTLKFALQTIANTFVKSTSGKPVTIQTDDSGSLTFATGFKTGLAAKGKSGKRQQKSLSKNLGHLTTPQKGETYLAYMIRLAKHAGCNIKMSNIDENVIIVKPPTYDRDEAPPFELIHYLAAPDNASNNVISGQMRFNLDNQPSVVIVEANTSGDGKFYQSSHKAIAVNELTGYTYPGASDPSDAIPSVVDAIAQLTNGNLGSGYVLAPFNTQLYGTRANLSVDIDTEVSMPYYTVDYNAHTREEATFAAAKILAEHQDRYVEFRYIVQGWTMAGTTAVWQPDMMVNVSEEIFHPGSSAFTKLPMWIRRVNFTKSRSGGTTTEIVCQLPYTHNFEITD